MARRHGVTLVRGQGRVARPGVVEVGGRRSGTTGSSSRPARPRSRRRRGLDGVEAWTTREATSSNEVPASLIVIGGGVAGCELAQLYRRLGSEVTIAPTRHAADAARRRRGGRAPAGRVRGRRNRGATRRRCRTVSEGIRVTLAAARRSSGAVARRHRPEAERRGARAGTARRGDLEARHRRPTSASAPPRTSGRSATAPAWRSSPTSASTRRGSPRRTSRAAGEGRLPRDPRRRVHRPSDRDGRRHRARGRRLGPLEDDRHTARLDLREAEAAGLRQDRRRPGAAHRRRRGRGRARVGRVVPAADARDPRRRSDRRPPRRDPALPDILRGRVLRLQELAL